MVISHMYNQWTKHIFKALTHYTHYCKDFSEKICSKNCCLYIKLLEKSLQLGKKSSGVDGR